MLISTFQVGSIEFEKKSHPLPPLQVEDSLLHSRSKTNFPNLFSQVLYILISVLIASLGILVVREGIEKRVYKNTAMFRP